MKKILIGIKNNALTFSYKRSADKISNNLLNTNVITDSSTEKIDNNENINYMDFNLITPSGYSSELLEDGGVLFKSSDKVFTVDFYEGTISDLDSALLEMGATSKGIKDVDKVSFTLS